MNGRPTHVSYPPVYRGTLTLSGQLATRGQPDALSGAVQGVRPRSRPRASAGEGGAGKGRGRKRRRSCHGADRGARVAPPKKGLTSRRCDRTRPTQHTVNRGSVYRG
jgi:hypothetical protein